MKTLLIKNAHTIVSGDKVYKNCDILVENNIIKEIGPKLNPHSSIDTIIDASHHIVIPGLVNTHHHLYQSLTRCMTPALDAKLFDWLMYLYDFWSKLTYNSLYHGSLISMAELVMSGCTTISDLFYVFPNNSDVNLEAVIQGANEIGVRIHACRGSMSRSRENGGLPPASVVQTESAIIEDCIRVVDKFHDPKPFAMTRIDLAPCSPFSITPELMRDTKKLADERNLLCHTHLAETLDEEEFCIKEHGLSPVRYMESLGWLDNNVYFAHCVHMNSEDIELLAKTGSGVAHCPNSNMRLGSGIAPIKEMIEKGVKVGVGVDGSSSNDGGNLLLDVRQALLLQRVKHGATAMTVLDAFKLGTIGGANVLNRDDLGLLEVGKAADMAIYNMNQVEYAGACVHDPLGALILGQPTKAETVIINGKLVVDKCEIKTMDMEKIIYETNKIVAKEFTAN